MSKQEKHAFKVGDWCYCEFELSQIMEIENGRITDISTGYIRMGSHDLSDRCFPLDKNIKVISEEFQLYREKLHKDGSVNLNYPRIHEWLVEKWVETCKDKPENVSIHYTELRRFYNEIVKFHEEMKSKTVEGINVFK
jgi:hypothetical protein